MQSNILWPIYALLKHLFLLLTVDNVFTYETENEGTKQLILDEKEEIWLKIRHEFIGDIDKILKIELQKIQDLDKQYQVAAKSGNTKQLGQMIRLAPKFVQEKKNLKPYQLMAQQCMDKWNKLKVDIEQDLAVGEDSGNNDRSLTQILLDKEICHKDKARVILLYILRKGPQTIGKSNI